MSDYLSSVLEELVPRFVDEDGDWGRVVADAGAETATMTAYSCPLDATSTSTAHRERHGRWRERWLTRGRLVVVALTALLAVLLVTPALGIGVRLLDLIRGTPTRPEVRISTWSLDGRGIAFVSRRDRGNWELSVVNADGSGQRKLTRVAGDATPAWSPDGRKIAFEGRRDGKHNGLYVVNADGSGQRKLARRGFAPAWSPDGRRIAFFWGTRIYVMNADGSEHRTLVKLHNARKASLTWSPDGRKLAFLWSDCGDFCFNLYVVNADGSSLQSLTRLVGGGGHTGVASASTPAWTADGQKIAFVAPASDFPWSPDGQKNAFARLEAGLGIYVVKADGSGLRRLTRKSSGSYAAPAWSPNGRKIAFVFDRDDSSEVFVMNTDGSRQRNLTGDPAYDGDPSWSPDGRKLAFVSNRDGSLEVYVMNADGSGQRRLTQRGG